MKHILTVILFFTLISTISISARTLHSSHHHSSPNILSQANDHFTVAFLQNLETLQNQEWECSKPKENVLLSPFSLGSTLTYILAGAGNQTYAQIYNTLGLNISHLKTSTLFSDYSNLVNLLTKNNKMLTVNAALAIQKNFALNEVFIDNVTAAFGAQVYVEDFCGNATKSTKQINDCISDDTHSDIPQLFSQSIPSNTGASLLNSLYFKAPWKKPFSLNKKGFLQATAVFNYLQLSIGQLIEIPYEEPSSLSLYLFLPPLTFNGSSISSLLTPAKLETAITLMKPETVNLIMPQINLTSSLSDSEQVLKKLGIVDAFSGDADFFGVNSDYNLRLSELLVSKATLELSQSGTEFSAASGLILAPAKKEKNEVYELLEISFSSSSELNLEFLPNQNFTVDRPFLFLLRDTLSQLTLISGVMTNFK